MNPRIPVDRSMDRLNVVGIQQLSVDCEWSSVIHYLDARERDPRSRDSGHRPADTADTYRANGALELIIHGLSRLLLRDPGDRSTHSGR